MTAVQLQDWIEHPERMDRNTLYELRTMVARYPYFQTVRLLYLKNLYLLHDAAFGTELRRSVLYVSDRRALFYLIEGERYVLEPRKLSPLTETMQEEPSVDRTLFLIDSFLSSFPEEQAQPAIELDYSMDYASYLIKEEEEEEKDGQPSDTPKLRGQDLIDDFLNGKETSDENSKESDPSEKVQLRIGNEAKGDKEEPEDDGEHSSVRNWVDDGCFTETLAKIYIKQHRYEKALEIIKKLSLNYPKKNAYFADQIRFLEKLIINTKSK